MSLLFETILIKNGAPVNLDYHQKRFDAARTHFWNAEQVKLSEFIKIPEGQSEKVLRCRIDYDDQIRDIRITEFVPKAINSLKIVVDDEIDYGYKYADRNRLDELNKRKGLSDDILIVKNGFVTDTSYANIVFSDGAKFFTSHSPLLKGTQREFLIDSGIISEEEIKPNDITRFQAWSHINALNPLFPSGFKPIERIIL
jgi:4-amino-4-deoxychorismate lyase